MDEVMCLACSLAPRLSACTRTMKDFASKFFHHLSASVNPGDEAT